MELGNIFFLLKKGFWISTPIWNYVNYDFLAYVQSSNINCIFVSGIQSAVNYYQIKLEVQFAYLNNAFTLADL